MTPTPPLPTLDPIFNQAQIVDAKTGQLTNSGWWFLFQLREGTQSAVNMSFLGVVNLFPSGGIVIPDLSVSGPNGSFHLSSTHHVVINPPVFTGGAVPVGSQITIYYDQDFEGGNPAPIFSTDPGGFAAEVNSLAIITTLNTRTSYRFGFDGQIWTLLSFETGQYTIPFV